jgi:hypothetical protein
MESVCKFEDFATSFPAYIDELHDFFRSRGVGFGAAEDVAPAVERMCADAVFGGEIASLVRAIIYRERDGLSPIELFELLLVAIGGAQVDEAAEEIHEPARQLLAFTKGVFHSRWTAALEDPSDAKGEDEMGEGEMSGTPQAKGEAELQPSIVTMDGGELGVVGGGEVQAKTAESVSLSSITFSPVAEAGAGRETRPPTEIFYRASMAAASGDEHEWPVKVETPAAEAAATDDAATDDVATDEVTAGYVAADYVARKVSAPPEFSWFEPVVRRRSMPWRWGWMAAVCAMVLAICAGVWAHGRTDVERAAVRKDAQHSRGVAKGIAAAGRKPSPAIKDLREEQAVAMIAAAEQRGRDRFVDQPDGDELGSGLDGDLGLSVEGPAGKRGRGKGGLRNARSKVVADGGASRTTAAEMRPSTAVASPVVAASGTRPVTPGATASAPHDAAHDVPGARDGVSAAMMAGRLLYAPALEYPRLARLAHIQGKVVVEAVVARDGSVVAANVLSGHRLLRGAAVRAVLGRLYRPYALNERPTQVATMVTVEFRLRQ